MAFVLAFIVAIETALFATLDHSMVAASREGIVLLLLSFVFLQRRPAARLAQALA